MGDFYQNGIVTTLHNLKNRSHEDLDSNLLEFSKVRPMSLIIPCLYSELQTPALENIINELSKVKYLCEIIIGLDQATNDDFIKAKKYFSRLPQHHRIIWNDGPRMKEIDKLLYKKEIAPKEIGKGRNAWYCFGYFNASGKSQALALHDADIVTYNREMLARLLYPVVNPLFNYNFCKGFYFRADKEKLNGRAVRLLVTPLLRTLKKFFINDQFLEYLDSFRYPLAGEFSMRSDLTKTIRIPSDWGLEIAILSEAFRNTALSRICQVEIADRYDHKHQDVSFDNPEAGLSKMSLEISRSIYLRLAQNGAVFTTGMFRSIKATYYRVALDILDQYYDDARMNNYSINRHAEEETIHLFASNVYLAGEMFLDNPLQSPFVPGWRRVVSAVPNIYQLMNDAVEFDNK